ncbi:DUF1819 family protein [Janthinobacterium sp. SUN100]|uniref:DUF1819 family protein n=1 Tax=Janthinobacterium sp. SUN100 TaxID=3004101 RepID=UPI0025AF4E95|nr:DUF1819 family protein [Janthinobacterium sp. SUN100]MDN2702028.1 DUF1819 family protein [Janthinobacterium sp. SUN100]
MTWYNAEIYVGALLPLESRRIARLLLTEPDQLAWTHAIEIENILQKRTAATAARQARLLRRRLTTLDAEGWKMIAERENEVVIQMLLAAAVKHSRLLGDFLLRVYADRQRRLETELARSDWQDFLAECEHHDASLAGWPQSTKNKMLQVILRILVEAKYIDSSKSMKLTPQSLHPDVRRYLSAHDETYVLDCLERVR